MKDQLNKIESSLAVLKWMIGVNLAFAAAIVVWLFFVL